MFEIVSNNPDTMFNLFGPTDGEPEQGNTYFFVIAHKDTDEAVGFVQIYNAHDDQANIGVCTSPANRRHGYATEGMRMAQEYAFKDLHVRKLQASILQSNESAQRMCAKLGYEVVTFVLREPSKLNTVLMEKLLLDDQQANMSTG